MDREIGKLEARDLGLALATVLLPAEVAGDRDVVGHGRGGVEVGGREGLARVEDVLHAALAVEDCHVVVDEDVRVVVVFEFAGDQHEAAVDEAGGALAEAVEGPDRAGVEARMAWPHDRLAGGLNGPARRRAKPEERA